jgi:hypothetical protein
MRRGDVNGMVGLPWPYPDLVLACPGSSSFVILRTCRGKIVYMVLPPFLLWDSISLPESPAFLAEQLLKASVQAFRLLQTEAQHYSNLVSNFEQRWVSSTERTPKRRIPMILRRVRINNPRQKNQTVSCSIFSLTGIFGAPDGGPPLLNRREWRRV